MEDITGLFNEHDKLNEQIPKLDDWIEMVVGNRVVISGVINDHPKYADGTRIVTSSLKGYKTNADGSVHAITRRSDYQLGQRLSEYDAQQLSAARNSFEKVLVPGRNTFC